MDEVLPNVFHWTRVHENLRVPVHSYYVADRLLLIDPMEPDAGLDAVAELGDGAPERIVLTVRHHLRHAERFAQRFGCDIVAHEAGLHAFADGPQVKGFAFGEEVAPGVTALELGALTPEDTVLHIHAGRHGLHFGDGLIRHDGAIGFVPDGLMGDDPDHVKQRTFDRLQALLGEDFDALLFAHGDPLPAGGRDALEAFVASR